MKSTASSASASKIGLLETLEVFSLVYNHNSAKFTLSLCYADGKTLFMEYDKHEYCTCEENDTAESAKWNLKEITADIIDDLEGAVPMKLQSE